MRLIDADELEKLFREVIGHIAKRPDINFNMEHMIRASAMVIEMIKDAPTVTPEPHWIPCNKRLPKKCNTAYLATMDYGKYGRAVGQRFFFDDNIGWNDKTVIAWMPLPEEYRGE